MRGIDCITTTDRPRPIVGRELEPASPRRQPRRLHVDRPCYVGRSTRGDWVWHCSLCPLPLGMVTNPAADWRTAIDEVTRHVRAAHADRDTPRTENGWLLAA